MYLQDSKATCGAVAIVNALKSLGVSLTVEAAIKLAGTDATRGTPVKGMRAALEALGYSPRTIHTDRFTDAFASLRGWLAQGVPVILLVDGESHWIVAIGTLGGRILVADSGGVRLVESYDWKQLAERWESTGRRKPWFGLAVNGPGPD